jgi:hypothetical protein
LQGKETLFKNWQSLHRTSGQSHCSPGSMRCEGREGGGEK